MNEELTNIEVTEGIEVVNELQNSPKNVGKKVVTTAIVGGVVAGVTGIVLLARKQRDRVTKWMAKKLQKKGYTVVEPLIDVEVNDENSESK